MILPSKIWIKIYGKYQEKRKIKKKSLRFCEKTEKRHKKISRVEIGNEN